MAGTVFCFFCRDGPNKATNTRPFDVHQFQGLLHVLDVAGVRRGRWKKACGSTGRSMQPRSRGFSPAAVLVLKKVLDRD
jgi:hypothetical protein